MLVENRVIYLLSINRYVINVIKESLSILYASLVLNGEFRQSVTTLAL